MSVKEETINGKHQDDSIVSKLEDILNLKEENNDEKSDNGIKESDKEANGVKLKKPPPHKVCFLINSI